MDGQRRGVWDLLQRLTNAGGKDLNKQAATSVAAVDSTPPLSEEGVVLSDTEPREATSSLELEPALLGEKISDEQGFIVITRDESFKPDLPMTGRCQQCGAEFQMPYKHVCPFCGETRANYYVRKSEVIVKEKQVRQVEEVDQNQIDLAPGETEISFEDGVLTLEVTVNLPEMSLTDPQKVKIMAQGSLNIDGVDDDKPRKLVVMVKSKATSGTKRGAYDEYKRSGRVQVSTDGSDMKIEANGTKSPLDEIGRGMTQIFTGNANIVISGGRSGTVIDGVNIDDLVDGQRSSYVKVERVDLTLPTRSETTIDGAGSVDLANLYGKLEIRNVRKRVYIVGAGTVRCETASGLTVRKAEALRFEQVTQGAKISEVKDVSGGSVSGSLTLENVNKCRMGNVSGSGSFDTVGQLTLTNMSGGGTIKNASVSVGNITGGLHVENVSGNVGNVTGGVRGKSSSPNLRLGNVTGGIR